MSKYYYFSIPYINSYHIIIQLTSLNDQLQYRLMINKNISKLPQSNRTHFFHIWPQFLRQRKKNQYLHLNMYLVCPQLFCIQILICLTNTLFLHKLKIHYRMSTLKDASERVFHIFLVLQQTYRLHQPQNIKLEYKSSLSQSKEQIVNHVKYLILHKLQQQNIKLLMFIVCKQHHLGGRRGSSSSIATKK